MGLSMLTQHEKFPAELAHRLIKTLGVTKHDLVHIQANPGLKTVTSALVQHLTGIGAKSTTLVDDLPALASSLSELTLETPELTTKIARLAKGEVAHHEEATKLITLRTSHPGEAIFNQIVNPAIATLYWAHWSSQIHQLRQSRPSQNVHLPSPLDAEQDSVSYETAYATFVGAFRVTSEQVRPGLQAFVNFLKGKSQVLILANPDDRMRYKTAIKFSIRDRSFCVSDDSRNILGYEVMGAPTRYTIEGNLCIPRPLVIAGRTLPALNLEFAQGHVTKWSIPGGTADDTKMLEHFFSFAGNCEVGEFAIGGNPAVSQYLPKDIMISEKAAVTIHLALGSSYKQPMYGVIVYNGVDAPNHTDLVIPFWPEFGGGMLVVDNIPVIVNGKYTKEILKYYPEISLLARRKAQTVS